MTLRVVPNQIPIIPRTFEGTLPPLGLPPLSHPEFQARVARLTAKVSDPNQGFFPRKSLFWKLTGQNVNMLLGLFPLLLQLAHPPVANTLTATNAFKRNPLVRGLETYLGTGKIISGNVREATEEANFLFKMHTNIVGGYATDPASILWVDQTLIVAGHQFYETFVGPLSPDEVAGSYEESKSFAALFGVPEEIIPATFEDSMRYYDAMIESPYIEVTKGAKDIMATFLAHIPKPIRASVLAMVTHFMPPKLREQFELPWDVAHQQLAQRSITNLKRILPLLPEPVRRSPLDSRRRTHLGEGGRIDAVVNHGISFLEAFGMEMSVNTRRKKPLSGGQVFALAVNRFRRAG